MVPNLALKLSQIVFFSSTGSSGGICEKSKMYSDGKKKSLNTGIITVQNYASHVPPKVSHITFAHEVGHNFGSPVSAVLKSGICHLFSCKTAQTIICSSVSSLAAFFFSCLLFYSMTLGLNVPLESLRSSRKRSKETTSCMPEQHQGTSSTITSSLSVASAI